jgi:hypothetical protein
MNRTNLHVSVNRLGTGLGFAFVLVEDACSPRSLVSRLSNMQYGMIEREPEFNPLVNPLDSELENPPPSRSRNAGTVSRRRLLEAQPMHSAGAVSKPLSELGGIRDSPLLN